LAPELQLFAGFLSLSQKVNVSQVLEAIRVVLRFTFLIGAGVFHFGSLKVGFKEDDFFLLEELDLANGLSLLSDQPSACAAGAANTSAVRQTAIQHTAFFTGNSLVRDHAGMERKYCGAHWATRSLARGGSLPEACFAVQSGFCEEISPDRRSAVECTIETVRSRS
jgi:hypothetical protein